MRISSNTFFDNNVAAMGQQQSRLMQTQLQASTGRKIVTASDDPVASARALEISQADTTNTQYTTNRNAASHTLTMSEGVLQSVTSLIQDVRTEAVTAGDASLTDIARQGIANGLSSRLQELVGLANSTDGLGNYLFSGYQSKTQPFVDTAAGMGYWGDDGQRQVQVSAGHQISSSGSGADIFMRIRNGNGTFVTQATVTNSGSGIASIGNVSNPALLTGHNYQIVFTVAAGVTTYGVNDTTLGVPVSSGNTYVSGQAISFDGIQLDVKGAPANGDSFTVTPSTNESLFTTISNLITALKTPVVSAGGSAQLSSSLAQVIGNLDNAQEGVLATRATIGLRLNEIDALQATGDNLGLQFKQTLSQLQDTDYTKTLSDLTMQQMQLQAAQKSFAQVSGLSLFSYL